MGREEHKLEREKRLNERMSVWVKGNRAREEKNREETQGRNKGK